METGEVGNRNILKNSLSQTALGLKNPSAICFNYFKDLIYLSGFGLVQKQFEQVS